jgi:hypothetical protein
MAEECPPNMDAAILRTCTLWEKGIGIGTQLVHKILQVIENKGGSPKRRLPTSFSVGANAAEPDAAVPDRFRTGEEA